MTAEDSSERYDVLLTGELLPDRHLDEVVRAVADYYRADESQVARLFAAAPRVCRRNLSRARAQRHVKALRRVGAVAELALRPAVAAAPAAASVPAGTASTAVSAPATSTSAPSAILRSPGAATADAGRAVPVPQRGADDPRPLESGSSGEPPPEVRARAAPAREAAGARPCRAGRLGLIGLLSGFALGLLATWWVPLPAQRGPDPAPGVADTLPGAGGEQPLAIVPESGDTGEPPAAASPSTPAVDGGGADQAVATEMPGAERPAAERLREEAQAGRIEAAALEEPATAPPASAAVAGADGPFGLAAGTPRAALDVLADGSEPGRKVLRSVPRPMPDIERVVAVVAPDAGLCALLGRSRALSTAADGVGLRKSFADMEAELDGRYGPQLRTNIRFSRAAPGAEQTWMQGLLDGQRTLASAWAGTADAPLPQGLEQVTLTAVAEAEDRGALRIDYRFSNHGECTAELAAGPARPAAED